jgi:hypothetical protein
VLLASAAARAVSPDELGAALPPDYPATGGVATAEGAPRAPADGGREAAFAARHVLTIAGGLGWARFSGRPIDQPALLSLAAEWRHRSPLGATHRWSADVGVRGALLRLPYVSLAAGEATSSIWSAVLIGHLGRRVGRAFELGASLGAGVSAWAGLGPMNPFTVDGAPASGPVPLPTLEASADLTYVTPWRFSISLLPRYTISSTTSPGLVRTIPYVTHADLLLAISLRL